MNRKSILIWAMAIGTLSSCMENNLYDAEAAREKAEKAFGMTIDPNQDWNMIKTVKANISIKEDALSDYKFKIYTANPLSAESSAALLAEKAVSTDAKGKADAELTFDMPSYMEYVYVARVDDHGRRLVKSAKVDNGTLDTEFGGSTVGTRGMETGEELPKKDCPYTKTQIETLVASALDVTQMTTTNYCDIKKLGTTVGKITTPQYTLPLHLQMWGYFADDGSYVQKTPEIGEYKLIITNGGVVTLQHDMIIAGVDVVVTEGSTLDITGHKLQMSANARLIIMPGGQLIDNNTDQNQWNCKINDDDKSALIYNAGTINAKWINLNFAEFYNAESGVINADGGIYLANYEGGIMTNWGHITANQIIGNGDQGTINNGCSLISKEKLQVKYLNQAKKTLIQCPYIRLENLTLRENSILRSETLYLNNTAIRYIGEGGQDKEGLISVGYIENVNPGAFSITNNIYFEANEYRDNSFLTTITNAITVAGGPGISKVGEADILIESGECNGKGNTPTDRVEETDTSGYFTYAFEDQNKDGGDYDMNDVVLYCSAPKDGKITVRLAAAGASKNLTVHFKNKQGNTDVALFNGSEIHDLFKVEKKELVNTGSGPNCAEISAEIEVGEGFSYQNHGDFYIKDEQGRESHTPAFDTRLIERGNVPYGICVPKEWKYPKERCGIQYAYPNFETWAGNMTSNKDWYETGVSGNIYEKKAE